MNQVYRVFDNGGQTHDRYRIVLGPYGGVYPVLTSGPDGNTPQGVFLMAYTYEKGRVGAGNRAWIEPDGDREIRFEDLPERVQTDVLKVVAELAQYEEGGPA